MRSRGSQPRQARNAAGNTMLVRRFYNILEVSPNGRDPVPEDVCEALAPAMIYTHVRHLYGKDRFWVDSATGEREQRSMAFEKRRLYRLDGKGRFVCGRGYLARVTNTLQQLGYRVFYKDVTPAGARPDAFEQNWDLVLQHVDFRPRQEEALLEFAAHDCGVFDAAPGFGKTFIMATTPLLYNKARFALITRGKDRISHLLREVSKFIPGVGQVGAGREHKARVTVYSADSLHKLEDGDVDFALVDEVHEMLADKYVENMARCLRSSRNFGLTATSTGRKDGTDARMESIFGPTIFRMTQQESEALGLVVPVEVRWLDVIMSHNPANGKADVARKRWGLWRNDERNQVIAEAANAHPDSQVLIIVATVEHAVYLAQHLPDFELCYGTLKQPDCDAYIRDGMLPEDYMPLPPHDRKAMQEEFASGELQKVIATDVWATGVSFEGLSVLIRGDGRTSKIMDTQIPGRVDRISEGKDRGIVYDTLDQFDEDFRKRARSREKNYAKRGWTQVKPKRSGRQLTLALND